MVSNTDPQQRVYLLDDSPVVRLGVRRILDENPGVIVCGEADSADAGIAGICSTQATTAIVEMGISGRDLGLRVLHQIFAVRPQISVLVLSAACSPRAALQALCAGARAYLCKDEPLSEIREALKVVLAGGIYVGRRFRDRPIFQILRNSECEVASQVRRLTPREMELFEALGKNQTLSEIAATMGLSVKTVETHRAHVVEKLGMRDSAALVEFAADWRIYRSTDCENLRAA